ncbi:MAG TPA: hypothetical protein VM306_04155 [Lentzea sp.]|nr:hypothetical protein [Lentzea sp.]HUQ54818.1 hypothetical protein [Lentzea sp.]
MTWAEFLRSEAEVVLAMDFIETVTLTGARQYILAVVHHGGRRVRILGTTAHPTHAWVTQAVRKLLMDLEDACEPDSNPLGLTGSNASRYSDRTVSAESFTSIGMPFDLGGRNFRHAHGAPTVPGAQLVMLVKLLRRTLGKGVLIELAGVKPTILGSLVAFGIPLDVAVIDSRGRPWTG